MARREYQESLETLRSEVEAMGELVVERLDRGLDALERKDVDAAEAVIEGDAEINEAYLDLEAACIDLFALQQPVASDLRFVAASFKILTDLERIGDLATNFGRYTLAADRQRLPEDDVYDVGNDARDMVVDAIDAMADLDADMARDVIQRDDDVDRLWMVVSRIFRSTLRTPKAAEELGLPREVCFDYQSAARQLERVADHAVNVAARTLYMIDNDPELIY